MYKEIVKILECPKCKGQLTLSIAKEENGEVIEGELKCQCGQHYHIKDGVVNFGSVEQEDVNSWSKYYEDTEYDKLDKEILAGTPKNLRELNDKAKDLIIDNVNNSNREFVLDIATGRGMLFTEMLKKLKSNAEIICADLSFEVLKYDRLKAKRINPDIKVNYIACDASNLPFKRDSIDMATSFYGISNMADVMKYGIKEVARVLKCGQAFFNTYILIKKSSKGYELLKQYHEQKKIADTDKQVIKESVELVHKDLGFKKVETISVGESIGEKCEFDLIPFEGEWFSISVLKCEK